MENVLENGTFYDMNGRFLFVATKEIKKWTTESVKPFCVVLDEGWQFENFGLGDIDEYLHMKVGEVKSNLDGYEGTYLIRIQ